MRGTTVAKREPGQITQWIGASLLPSEIIMKNYGEILERFKVQIKIPGLLFIDTPGHESFSNLRRRGGSAADIAILVVDIMQGVERQTEESIEILKSRRTPFVVAANKVDLIPGWRSVGSKSITQSVISQPTEVQREMDTKIYTIMGSLSKLGLNSDRFDRIKDFTKTIAIIPTSAKTGEGIPELLTILVGLTQSFMRKELLTSSGPARGTILEVEEEVGLGVTVNAIIYDGKLNIGDRIVLGGKGGPILTTIRTILVPKPLDEIRDPRDKFSTVQSVGAASGIKIAAPNLENALAGSSLYAIPDKESPETYVNMIKEEFERLIIHTDKDGVILKTDTLGALEAITESLRKAGTPIRIADVGDISKREVIEAEVVKGKNRLLGIVLGFNVKTLPDAEEEARKRGVPIIIADIIYDLLDKYSKWLEAERYANLKAELESHIRPGKIRVLPGLIFRRSKPAIFGVEVLAGRIGQKYPLINGDGKRIGEIMRIQDRGRDVGEAISGTQVAVSVDKAVIHRNVFEGDILYVAVPERSAKELLTRLRDHISPEEVEVLRELTEIMRRENPFWNI
ncbi:translation initiation factor IF-2 [Candidatus Bathyarchaeota archaeon]|nr:translation initiation factor IF-2 [Candidatus Bathyarchaeota archaeon]